MKTIVLLISAMFFMTGCVTTLEASPKRDKRVIVVEQHRRKKPKKVIVVGTIIKKRPAQSILIHYKDFSFYYSGGVFYRPVEDHYEVIKPQIGMVVPELPEDGVKKIVMKDEVLYSYDDVLYKKIVTPKGIKFEVKGFINE